MVIYGRRSFEPQRQTPYQVLLHSPQVHRFYLNELFKLGAGSTALELMRLIVAPQRQAAAQARKLLAQAEQSTSSLSKSVIMELIETTLVYKFPHLSREELAKMLGFAESVKQTRVYQEGLEEGLQHERSLILKQLTRKLGPVPPEARSQIDTFSVSQLEALGEALLDFSQPSDLITWLQENSQG